MQNTVIQRFRNNFSFIHKPHQRREIRLYIFLLDVLHLSLTTFGGAQVHIALFIRLLVIKRRYLSEAELLELYALCQILPGPGSTQTLTAVAYRIGGPRLAFLALIIWITPAVFVMTLAAILLDYANVSAVSLDFTRYLEPVAVGLLIHSAYSVGKKVITNTAMAIIAILAAAASYYNPSPWVTPILLLAAGTFTAIRYRYNEELQEKEPLKIEWSNFILYGSILITAAVVGHFTMWLPVRLFENFYRNGSLIFGGGQVLVPVMYNEFVEFKHYLSSQEFLSGYALSQTLPGPVFSFCSYIGALSMRQEGVLGQVLGSFVATVGIFLPGTLLIFFIIRFWEQLKRYRVVKASLHGINAAGAGLVLSAALLLLPSVASQPINWLLILLSFLFLEFANRPAYWLIIFAFAIGFIF